MGNRTTSSVTTTWRYQSTSPTCCFITTANTTDTIPRPLLDRMEVIELSSYTDEEKLMIAKQHLLPKERKRHGLNGNSLRVSDDAIREIITPVHAGERRQAA